MMKVSLMLMIGAVFSSLTLVPFPQPTSLQLPGQIGGSSSRASKRKNHVAMQCGAGLPALVPFIGTMLVTDFAAKYLLGASAQVLAGKLGVHSAAKIAEVVAAAKKGQKWAQSAAKIMSQARFMRRSVARLTLFEGCLNTGKKGRDIFLPYQLLAGPNLYSK